MTTQKNIFVRAINEKDLVQVIELIHRTIDLCYRDVYSEKEREYFKNLHSANGIRQRACDGSVLVIENENEIVATGGMIGEEFYGVFIKPEMQGQGLGQMMMGELEKLARAKGLGEISLNISRPSRDFYESLGYQVFDEPQIDIGDGTQMKYWQARKSL